MRLSVSMDDGLGEKVKTAAKCEERTTSAIIRLALKKYLGDQSE